jgi:hypothetical protein
MDNVSAVNPIFRRKRLAGRAGVGLLASSALLSFSESGVTRLLHPAAVSFLGWAALALILWASVCPACGGAIALGGRECAGCRDRSRVGTRPPFSSWRQLPVLARVLPWVFCTFVAAMAFLSFAGVD